MSELITPEEFINDKEFVKALKTINASLADLLKTFDALSTSVKGYYTEVNKGAKSNADLVKNQNLVTKSTKEITAAEKELERLRKDTEKTMAKKSVLNSQEYKDNVRAKKELRELTDAEAKRRGNIGKYKEDIVKAYVAIRGAVALAQGAWKAFNFVLESTEGLADKFEAVAMGVKQSILGIGKAISNLDFKNFFSDIEKNYQKGKELSAAMEEMEAANWADKMKRADEEDKLMTLKIKVRTDKDKRERIKAVDEIIAIEDERERRRVEILTKGYNKFVEVTASTNKVSTVALQDFIKRDGITYKLYEEGIKQKEEIATREEKLSKLNVREKATRGITVSDKDIAEYTKISNEISDINKLYSTQIDLATRLDSISKVESNTLTEMYDAKKQAEIESRDNTLKILARKAQYLEGLNKDEIDGQKEKSKLEEEESKKSLARFEYEWKQKEKIKDGVLQDEWDKAQELLNAEYEGRDIELRNFQDTEEAKRDAIEETKNMQIDSANAAANLALTIGDRSIANLEYQKQKELDAAGDNAKKKEKIEADYAKKIGKIKRNQAIADKGMSLFNILMSTRMAVMAIMAQLFVPFSIKTTQATWTKILGGIQAAAVLAAPIPKFFKGVKDFKGGAAVVGEKGMELVESPKGSFLTPDKATTMLLPEHSTVHTHEKTIEKLKGMDSEKVNELINEQRLTRKAIANQKHNSTVINERGARFLTQYGNSTTEWINKNFR